MLWLRKQMGAGAEDVHYACAMFVVDLSHPDPHGSHRDQAHPFHADQSPRDLYGNSRAFEKIAVLLK